VSVEVIKVSDDDGHGQRDGKDSSNDAQRPHEFTPDTNRCDVTIADSRHGHNSPPERPGYWRQLGVLFTRLGVVSRRAEDHHRHHQEEEEHSELVETGFYRQTEDSQSLRVFR